MIAPAQGVWERLQGIYDEQGQFILHGPDGAAVDLFTRWQVPAGLAPQEATWIHFSWDGGVYDGAVFVREAVGAGLFSAQIQAHRIG